MVLADWAAIAIDNARLYRTRARAPRRARAGRPAGWRPRPRSAARSAAMTDLDRVLELVVKRSRALLDARAAEIALLDGDELVIAAVAGEGIDGAQGTRLPVDESLAGAVAAVGRHAALRRISRRRRSPRRRARGAAAPIVTPMLFRSRTGRRPHACSTASATTGRSRATTSACCEAFAASAATAVATAQTARDEALRRSIEASEEERTALGARAARRDAAGHGRPADDAVGRPAQRRPAGAGRGHGRGRRPPGRGRRRPARR